MNLKQHINLFLCSLCMFSCASGIETVPSAVNKQAVSSSHSAEKEALAESVGVQAYLYGAALTTQFYFRNRMKKMIQLSQQPGSAVKFNSKAADGLHFNEILHMQTKATHEMNIAGSPNVDTRYSAILFNLEHGAQVLHVPSITNRYFSINITDAYLGNRPYIGSRRV